MSFQYKKVVHQIDTKFSFDTRNSQMASQKHHVLSVCNWRSQSSDDLVETVLKDKSLKDKELETLIKRFYKEECRAIDIEKLDVSFDFDNCMVTIKGINIDDIKDGLEKVKDFIEKQKCKIDWWAK